MRSVISFLSLLLLLLPSLHAQRGYSFTVGSGFSYYYGDLSAGFSNLFVRPVGHASVGYYFTKSISLRFGLSYTELGSADSLVYQNRARKKRDLHFRSPITEISGIVYWELFPDRRFNHSWQNKPHFSPHIFAGVAIFGFQPKARYQGEMVKLQPLGTEGQYISGAGNPTPYPLLALAFPFGVGVSHRFGRYLGNNVALSFDLSYRKTLTDYIDDVSTDYPDFTALTETSGPLAAILSDPSGKNPVGSQRGNPNVKDGYLFGLVSLTFYLDQLGYR